MTAVPMAARVNLFLSTVSRKPRNPRKIPADAVVWVPELRPLAEIHRLTDPAADQGHTVCGLVTIGWERVTGRQAVDQVCQTHCTRCWGVG